jgi:hypothetical protein
MRFNNIHYYLGESYVSKDNEGFSSFVFIDFNMLFEYFVLCEKNPGISLAGIIEAKEGKIENF